uniref:Nuclear receptor coactivator 6 n=1 Tax=Lepisosteus oculatus TaxID=7918 RepID=W5MAF8_LEPOC
MADWQGREPPSAWTAPVGEPDTGLDSGVEDDHDLSPRPRCQDNNSNIFIAFKGNMGDEDFQENLHNFLESMPGMLELDSERLLPQRLEPWNSVRVTFNIPRDAADRLRLIAQNNQQQLRDLGILSVQIEGEGAINVALAQNRGQEVRVNGPIGAANQMRMDMGFPMQQGPGPMRMNSPSVSMVTSGPGMGAQLLVPGGGAQMQVRTVRPPSHTDTMDPLLSGLAGQQQQVQPPPHVPTPLQAQAHHMPAVQAARQMNPAALQQLQQQQPQHPPLSGARTQFTPPNQIPIPAGWNQLPSGALQPPPAQGPLGPAWKKMPPAQMATRPSLATVQTPSHPPPPYPFGSQQAGQAFNAMGQQPQQAGNPQFAAPQPKNLQGPPVVAGPRGPPPPPPSAAPQTHLTSKSPVSSPSPFQQGSPGTPPMMGQSPAQLAPRPPAPQGFPQAVSSPGRAVLGPQGNMQPGFMVMAQQGQIPQGSHPGMGGIPKRLPMGFQNLQGNQNFLQGQVTPSTSGTLVNTNPQLQSSQSIQHAGVQPSASVSNHMQGTHVQPNVMGPHGSMNNQPPGSTAAGSMGQPSQGIQTQMIGMQHQPIPSSPGQMVQGQSGQTVLSRAQIINQGQILTGGQNPNMIPQRGMTPPKQMMPQQGQTMIGHGQVMGSQGHQVILPQNTMMEQMIASQIQGNKFGAKGQAGVMQGQIMRGPSPNVQGGQQQATQQPQQSQQIPMNGNPNQVMGLHGQPMRLPGSHHLLSDPSSSAGEMALQQMLPDVQSQQPQQQGIVGPSHMQVGNGHFPGHGMPFNTQFGGQMPMGSPCVQPGGFPGNKDVTLTSPLLVNLLQSDISASQFGQGGKQTGVNQTKPKKKKPPRKKKTNNGGPPGQQPDDGLGGLDGRPPGMEDAEGQALTGEQGVGMDTAGPKISDFTNRPPGFPAQPGDQRTLQQIPIQFMQQQQQQMQEMMMMLMMQQDPKSVRLPLPQGGPQPRGPLNPTDGQRMPVPQQGSMPMMISLQGSGTIPPSPDKPRGPLMVNPQLAARRMPLGEAAQAVPSLSSEEVAGMHTLQDGSTSEMGHQAGNGGPQIVGNPGASQLMMKPGPSPLPQHQGASPQHQLQQPQQSGPIPGSHGLHFPNAPTTSQASRPKTPNRASPRPYYPHTPTNRPPSTEPSEINLSPERLNASIAGLFPPQINIPLPPRQPNLNRGFDQQGLNPTTLKAIGQAPSSLTSLGNSNNGQQTFTSGSNAGGTGTKLEKVSTGGLAKRSSPSNSRRSSPASSRKTTPSPGRQNAKAKLALTSPQHQQPMVNPQNILGNPPPVLPSSVGNTVPSSTSGTQHIQNPFPSPLGNPTEMNKEGQTTAMEARHTAQSQRDPSLPEIKSPSATQEQKSIVEESSRRDASVPEKVQPLLSTPEDSKTAPSPTLRDAPTSLGQLLDISGAPNVSLQPILDGPQEDDQNRKVSPRFAGDQEAVQNPSTSQSNDAATLAVVNDSETFPNTNPVPNVPAVMQRPASSTSIPSSQITVFVTSNQISSSTSASTHVPPTLVSTVVTVPNKNIKSSESQASTSAPATSRPAQFITGPVFINPIFQVPASPMPPSTNVMTQPVTMVGPLQMPSNIQFSPASTTTQPASINPPNTQTTRPLVLGQVQPGPVELPSPRPNTIPSPSSQPLTSPPPCASPGAVHARRSPMSPTATSSKSKLEKIGQMGVTKTSVGVSESTPKNEDHPTPPVVEAKPGSAVESPCHQASHVSAQTNLPEGEQQRPAPLKVAPAPVPASAGSAAGPPNSVGSSPASATPVTPTEGPPIPPVPETSQLAQQKDLTQDKGLQGNTQSTASSQPEPTQQELPTVEKTGDEAAATVTEHGEAKGVPEKPKASIRRSSRADRDTEEGAGPLEAAENGQRKRSARPGAASASTALKDSNTGTSPTQAKRRKSK